MLFTKVCSLFCLLIVFINNGTSFQKNQLAVSQSHQHPSQSTVSTHSTQIRLARNAEFKRLTFKNKDVLALAKDEVVELANRKGIHYRQVVKKALEKDAASLSILLQATKWMDGAAAETHSEILWGLLHIWDDQPFCVVLMKQPKKIQQLIFDNLIYESPDDSNTHSNSYLQKFFPNISKLGSGLPSQ